MFKPWTVPKTQALAPGESKKIVRAVMQLQKDLKKELKSTTRVSISVVKISMVGGSNIFSADNLDSDGRKKELVKRGLQVEQGRVAERFKRHENALQFLAEFAHSF